MTKRSRKIIAMNNPGAPLEVEIPFLLSCGVDGVEITAEPPCASLEQIRNHWNLVTKHIVIGHTRDDFAFASSEASERESSILNMMRSIDLFKEAGIKRVNIHPHRGSKNLTRDEVFKLNVDALDRIALHANHHGMELMLENQPPFPLVSDMQAVISKITSPIYILLDLAHAVCFGSASEAEKFIIEFAALIKHIHISDNDGSADQHLFPGYGLVDLKHYGSLINRLIPSDVAVSLESFRVMDGGKLRENMDEERPRYTTAAIELIREIFQ